MNRCEYCRGEVEDGVSVCENCAEEEDLQDDEKDESGFSESRFETVLRALFESVSWSMADEAQRFKSEQGLDDLDMLDMLAECSVETFEMAGVLTMNKGLVLRLQNGTEVQLTITSRPRW
jgi:hypothetical protein